MLIVEQQSTNAHKLELIKALNAGLQTQYDRRTSAFSMSLQQQ
jgi:hypothetical protein